MFKKRLWQLLKDAQKYVLLQVLFQWISLICQIVLIFSLTDLLGAAIKQTALNASKDIALIVIAVILRYLSDRKASDMSHLAGADVKRILRGKIYRKLLKLGVSYREHTSTAAVVQMAVEGVEQLETYFGKYLSQLFYALLAPLTLFAVLSFTDLKASLILLLFVPLIPMSIVIVQKIAKRLLSKYWSIYTELGDSFLENLQGLTTLKIYEADEMKAKEMDEESEKFRRITMKVLTMQLNSTSVMDIMAYGGAAAGMIIALRHVGAGTLDVTGCLRMIMLSAEFFLPMRVLGSYFHIAMNGMAASDRIFELLDLEEPQDGQETLENKPTTIEIRDLSFSYDGQRSILDGVSLDLKPGTITMITGLSGSGKSTLASVLCGKNKHYKGSVRIQDKELSKISEASLLQTITLVSSDSRLIKGTVRDNLLYGKPDAGDDELNAVLKQVNLYDYLSTQNGLDTLMEERANNLSGGQRQRLALARALLHDTPVYIFDEATSNIDQESEEMIMNVIQSMNKTVLLISHRLAHGERADTVGYLEAGKLKEYGTHSELMKEGSYADLFNAQRRMEQYGYEGGSL